MLMTKNTLSLQVDNFVPKIFCCTVFIKLLAQKHVDIQMFVREMHFVFMIPIRFMISVHSINNDVTISKP